MRTVPKLAFSPNKIATQWWPNIIITESKQTIHDIYLLFSRYYVHIMLLIWSKNWNCVMVVSVFLKIKFRHVQISVTKIGIPMSKIACINIETPPRKKNLFLSVPRSIDVLFKWCLFHYHHFHFSESHNLIKTDTLVFLEILGCFQPQGVSQVFPYFLFLQISAWCYL